MPSAGFKSCPDPGSIASVLSPAPAVLPLRLFHNLQITTLRKMPPKVPPTISSVWLEELEAGVGVGACGGGVGAGGVGAGGSGKPVHVKLVDMNMPSSSASPGWQIEIVWPTCVAPGSLTQSFSTASIATCWVQSLSENANSTLVFAQVEFIDLRYTTSCSISLRMQSPAVRVILGVPLQLKLLYMFARATKALPCVGVQVGFMQFPS